MTGWTLEYVWFELDYDTAVRLYNYLPNHFYRMHASTARLGFAIESFLGVKYESFESYLEPWMRPDAGDERGERRAFFSPGVIRDVDLAFDLGLLSQSALVALGPKRLRESGAFDKGRITDTTIGG